MPPAAIRPPVYADNMVATSQPLAAQAGLTMLTGGGNAVDAAIAAAITLTVVEPTSNGVGSDAFALVYDGQSLHGLNGSGRAPAAWTPDRFAGRASMPQRGWDTVTVPGAPDAWATLSQRFGQLPFPALFAPAIRYARHGFPVSPITAAAWARAAPALRSVPGFADAFLPQGSPPLPGQRFSLPALADSLQDIAETHARSFYRGALAQRIAEASAASGGAMTRDDLAAHRSDWAAPLSVAYRDTLVYELPPNGQGLAALIALGVLERLPAAALAPDDPLRLHLQIEAVRAAFDATHRHVGDPEHMAMDPRDLLAPAALDRIAAAIHPDRASPPGPPPPEDHGTVLVTAADSAGRMVSLIQSNYMGFGSGVVVPGTGVSLQNRGSGFTLEPGHPNRVGPGKRPFHTIIPAFAARRGAPWLAFGVMGGHMQPQGHVQLLTRMADHGVDPQIAADMPRWYLGRDGAVSLEAGWSPAARAGLRARGHRLDSLEGVFGGAQVIARLTGEAAGYVGGSDPRKDGQVIGT